MLVLAWEYLTGRAVATDPTDRTAAEWPPHPDRVFQALVAAWGARGEDVQERAALAWVAGLGPPQICAPDEGLEALPCAVPTVFVPTNDVSAPRRGSYGEKMLAILPSMRGRAARHFPAMHVGAATCALSWADAEPTPDQHAALVRLTAAVTHVGHSSSLVRMWMMRERPPANWIPAPPQAKSQRLLRVADPSRLDALIDAYAQGGPQWRRPPVARWCGYLRAIGPITEIPRGHLDDRLIVLRQVAGQRLQLQQTLRITDAMRGILIAHANETARELVSGHAPDGSPSRRPHCAILPLAHVGHKHADGHLLGLALALPHGLDYPQEEAVLGALARAQDAERGTLQLTLGAVGTATLLIEERDAAPHALRPQTWCRPAEQWATVTPIVLDRLPQRGKDPDSWAADQVVHACERQGLPQPESVAVQQLSPLVGAPPAREFPPLVRKDGVRGWHVHARIRFTTPIAGPLLLGAGRFRGYGLCRPLPQGTGG